MWKGHYSLHSKKCKCIKDKKPNKKQTAPLQSIITHVSFELVTTDYLYLGDYECILFVVDHVSKFVDAFPPQNNSGGAVADLMFNKYFLDFGFPKHFLHDQGKEFDNKYLNVNLKLPVLNHPK